MGTCLELDPSTLMIQMPKTKKVSLGFTFGVNISGNLRLLFFATDFDFIENSSVIATFVTSNRHIDKSKVHINQNWVNLDPKFNIYFTIVFDAFTKAYQTKYFGLPI